MVSKILIPIDGSEASYSALEYAVKEAKTHNASLEILHAMSFTEDMPDSKQQQIEKIPSAWVADYLTRVKIKDENLLKFAMGKAEAQGWGSKTTTKLLIGDPANTILQESIEGNFDLIVIGSRGLGGVKEFILGSVSHKVVSQSKIPVLVVK